VRTLLVGTTALAAGLLMAGWAEAQTAGPKAPFTAILDGEANANFGIQSSTQNTAHAREFGMQEDVWMRFFFEARADNGLTYGWLVRIDGASSSITANGFSNDREAIYFRHPAWGTTEIGNTTTSGKNGFPYVTADWGPPTSSQRYLGPDGTLERAFVTDTRAATMLSLFDKVGPDNAFPPGRALHLWYGTPEYAGFSGNVEFTPDGTNRNEEQFVTSTQAGAPSTTQSLGGANFQNIIGLGLNWHGQLGPVAIATGVQGAHAQSKNNFGLAGGSEFSNQAFKDGNSLHTGVKLNYAGLQWAVDYSWYNHSGLPAALAPGSAPVSTWGWDTGLEYFFGPWTVGGYYQYSRAPGIVFPAGTTAVSFGGVPQSINGVWEANQYGVGLGYTVAPGMRLYGEAFYYDLYNTHVTPAVNAANSGNARNPHGQIYLIGTSIAW
jgi:outer membrane protein OmpU